MSKNNPDRNVAVCIVCQHEAASEHHLFCPKCWSELDGLRHNPPNPIAAGISAWLIWSSEPWRAPAPAEAVAR